RLAERRHAADDRRPLGRDTRAAGRCPDRHGRGGGALLTEGGQGLPQGTRPPAAAHDAEVVRRGGESVSIAVELDQVTCRDADQALNGVSVAVPAGKLTIVTGSGRNLFMRVATGLSAPEFGTVRLGGRVLTGLNASARARVRRERAGMMLEPE